MSEHNAASEAMATRLVREASTCELTSLYHQGARCSEPAAAVRFDGLFVDAVCREHAERAQGRGGTVVIPGTSEAGR